MADRWQLIASQRHEVDYDLRNARTKMQFALSEGYRFLNEQAAKIEALEEQAENWQKTAETYKHRLEAAKRKYTESAAEMNGKIEALEEFVSEVKQACKERADEETIYRVIMAVHHLTR